MSFSLLIFIFLTATSHALNIREASINDLQLAFNQKHLTSRKLVEFYIGEIQKLNPVLNGVIEINPDALNQADKADHERKESESGSLSRLHGIPFLLKDNIATKDRLNTTSGSFALLRSIVPRDAGVVTKLRKAGAIILGKASIVELNCLVQPELLRMVEELAMSVKIKKKKKLRGKQKEFRCKWKLKMMMLDIIQRCISQKNEDQTLMSGVQYKQEENEKKEAAMMNSDCARMKSSWAEISEE